MRYILDPFNIDFKTKYCENHHDLFRKMFYFRTKLLLACSKKLLTRLPLPVAIPLYTLMMTISKSFAYDFGLVIDQLKNALCKLHIM